MQEENQKAAEKIAQYIKKRPGYASAWGRGVKAYALGLLDDLHEWANYDGEKLALNGATFGDFEKLALNGAEDWRAYSWGGGALIYDGEIARTLSTPSELKRTNNGEKRPNRGEQWLDVQARALGQASRLLYKAMKASERGL